jgi:hypothetical protein
MYQFVLILLRKPNLVPFRLGRSNANTRLPSVGSTMNRQYIRSRSGLPGVEALVEEPLDIPFVGSTKHRDAIDSSLRSQGHRFSRRLQFTQAYSTVGWLHPRTIVRVKVDPATKTTKISRAFFGSRISDRLLHLGAAATLWVIPPSVTTI